MNKLRVDYPSPYASSTADVTGITVGSLIEWNNGLWCVTAIQHGDAVSPTWYRVLNATEWDDEHTREDYVRENDIIRLTDLTVMNYGV